MMLLAPVPTPHGLLTLRQAGEALALEPERGTRLEKAFMRGSGHGLLCWAPMKSEQLSRWYCRIAGTWGVLCGRALRTSWCCRRCYQAARVHSRKNELDQIAAAVPPHRSTQSKASLACLLTAAPCAHVGGASHGTHDTTVRASPSR
jgi:hypothetical protein